MSLFFTSYDVNAVTWFWLSFLLCLVVFFRFTRLWSLRNLDLLLLLSLSPGLILIREDSAGAGYAWLFTVTLLLTVRMAFDGFFPKRPRLEANLNPQGLLVLSIAISGFLVEKIVIEPIPDTTVQTLESADRLLKRQDASGVKQHSEVGPSGPLLATPAALMQGGQLIAARTLAILAHTAVIAGLIVIGIYHFRNGPLGLAMACTYLLLPCTAIDAQSIHHVLPSALILWAVVFFRKPVAAGTLLGLACGSLLFPIFLIPLWLSFYNRRGAIRFAGSLVSVGVILFLSIALTSADTDSLMRQIIGWVDWESLEFRSGTQPGFWSLYDSAYRIPVFAAYVIMLILLTVFPRKKSLEQLLASSAAIVMGTQFWYTGQGGVYLLWYVPLVLTVVFRPRLSHLGPPIYTEKVSEPPLEARPETRVASTSSAVSVLR